MNNVCGNKLKNKSKNSNSNYLKREEKRRRFPDIRHHKIMARKPQVNIGTFRYYSNKRGTTKLTNWQKNRSLLLLTLKRQNETVMQNRIIESLVDKEPIKKLEYKRSISYNILINKNARGSLSTYKKLPDSNMKRIHNKSPVNIHICKIDKDLINNKNDNYNTAKLPNFSLELPDGKSFNRIVDLVKELKTKIKLNPIKTTQRIPYDQHITTKRSLCTVPREEVLPLATQKLDVIGIQRYKKAATLFNKKSNLRKLFNVHDIDHIKLLPKLTYSSFTQRCQFSLYDPLFNLPKDYLEYC